MVAGKRGNIYFVGLMGAGKTTVGRLLAKQLNKTFYDSDHEVELRTGVKIPVIFELEGEAGFRKRETAMIEELCKLDNIVLATGGGAVIASENRQCLAENGVVIYLRASVHDLWVRTRNDKNRPLLQNGDAKAKLSELFKARDPLYRSVATYTVDTGSQPAAMIVQEIEKLLAEHS